MVERIRLLLARFSENEATERHPMHPAVPFASQHGARPKLGSTPTQVHGAPSRFLGRLRAIKQAPTLAIQIAEMIRLKAVGENPKQKVARQLRRRPPAKHRLPAVPELSDVEIAQTCDLDHKRLPVRRCRTDLDPRHEAIVTGAWRDEAQPCRGLCFQSDRPGCRQPSSN